MSSGLFFCVLPVRLHVCASSVDLFVQLGQSSSIYSTLALSPSPDHPQLQFSQFVPLPFNVRFVTIERERDLEDIRLWSSLAWLFYSGHLEFEL